ncbi:PSTK kinase, partial [Centropus unirufus]|nr:PSTK kinase [Centropus unirufus]
SRWKQSRQELLQCLELVLRALLGRVPLPGPGPRPLWQRVLAACREQGLLAPGPAARPLCLILDDNFYYRSMRLEVYRLARRYSLGYCQIFLECPLECCLQRNRLRTHPVPDETIRAMAGRMEVPDGERHAWERNSLILNSSSTAPEHDERILALLALALETPVQPAEEAEQENTEQKEADRAACAASAVHRADQACRRIISRAMRDAKDHNVPPGAMRSLAEELNRLKAEFLEGLRHGDDPRSQDCPQDERSGPAAVPAFQHGAAAVLNKYL